MSDPYEKWTHIPDGKLTVEAVEQTFTTLSDDLWLAAASLDRLLNDMSTQRALLEAGLQRTDHAVQRCIDIMSSTETSVTETSAISNATLDVYFLSVPGDAQLCHLRLLILQRLDKLNTYVEMLKVSNERPEEDIEEQVEQWEDDPWTGENQASMETTEFPIPLSTFLSQDIITTAYALAVSQYFASLEVLFYRHGLLIWPHRQSILDAIPIHSHPTKYRALLPSFNSTSNLEQIPPFYTARASPDFTENPEILSVILQSNAAFGIPIDSAANEIVPRSAEVLSTWYLDRVDRIILTTGMVDVALELIQHGASYSVPDLNKVGEELGLYSRFVYDAHGQDDEEFTFARWQTMEPISVVQTYLSHSTPDSLPQDVLRLALPYLYFLETQAERKGQPDSSIVANVLYQFILQSSIENVACIFEASKPTLPATQRVVKSDEDMVRLALAYLYGHNAQDSWGIMSRIFECLPAWDTDVDDADDDAFETTLTSLSSFLVPSTARTVCTSEDLFLFFKPLPLQSLSHALDILDVHLESGEILARWRVSAPLRWFLQSRNDPIEQLAWANRMARRAGGRDDQPDTTEEWEWLLKDMLTLCKHTDRRLWGAFGLLSPPEIKKVFFSGLLSTGKFDIAKNLLKSKLLFSSHDIEEMCLTCSRDYYDNSSSGNYKFGEMKLAYDCLDVPSLSARIVKEKEFIEATSRLSSFNIMSRPGVPISPIEIRLTKDRLSLISSVLSSNDDAYKHTEVLLDLVYKLGFREDKVAEIKTLAMLTDTALQAEDFGRAFTTCERMIDTVLALGKSGRRSESAFEQAKEVCWVACFQLGRQSEFEDAEKKLYLLGRSLELCPPEQLHDILLSWRRLHKEDCAIRKRKLSEGFVTHIRAPPKREVMSGVPAGLRMGLQDFHLPASPLLSSPDAAALASKTFRSVTSKFPFSRGRAESTTSSDRSRSGSRRRLDAENVSAQAGRVFSKGIGWLIGADDEQ